MSDNVKIQTKVQSFEDVQKSLQDIEKNFNKLTKAVNQTVEDERKETEGKSGDIQSINIGSDGGKDYSLQIKSNDGWQGPVLKPHYDSGWKEVEAGDNSYTFKHNLGSQILLIQGYFKQTTADGGKIFSFADSSLDYGDSNPISEFNIGIHMENSNTIKLGVGNDHVFWVDMGSSAYAMSSGFMRLIIWKTGIIR